MFDSSIDSDEAYRLRAEILLSVLGETGVDRLLNDTTDNANPNRDDHGRFTSGGNNPSPVSQVVEQTAKLGPQSEEETVKAADKAVEGWRARVGGSLTAFLDKVPGGKKAREKMASIKGKLEERYGKKAAAVIIGTANAVSWGAFTIGPMVGMPNYIPASALMLAGAAIAESFVQAKKVFKKMHGKGPFTAKMTDEDKKPTKNEKRELSRDEIQQISKKVLDELLQVVTENAWNPDLHPKDEFGRWTTGGLSKSDLQAAAKHLGMKNIKKMTEQHLHEAITQRLATMKGNYAPIPKEVQDIMEKVGGNVGASTTSSKEIIAKGESLPRYGDDWQKQVADPIVDRIKQAPKLSSADIHTLDTLTGIYQQGHIGGFVPIADLHRSVGGSADSLLNTILDGVGKSKYRLHPYTGSTGAMKDHEYTIPAGREYMQYVEILPTKNAAASFFATCDRDNKGHCVGGERGSTAADKAKYIGQKVGKAEHVHADKIEKQIAAAVGGKQLDDNEAIDVDAGKHGIEVKSLLKGGKTSITVHADALLRKVKWQQESPGKVFHTIVVDERATYEDGQHAESYSGNRIYYKRGSGRYALSKMHPVENAAELKKLLDTPDSKLPDNAKGKLPTGDALKKLKVDAEKAHTSRLTKDRARKARLKAAKIEEGS